MPGQLSFDEFCRAVHASVVSAIPTVVLTTGPAAGEGFAWFSAWQVQLASWSANGFTAILEPGVSGRVAVVLATSGGSLIGQPPHEDLTREGARRAAEAIAKLLVGVPDVDHEDDDEP